MKNWIRVLAAVAIAAMLSGCAGFGGMSNPDMGEYESSLSD